MFALTLMPRLTRAATVANGNRTANGSAKPPTTGAGNRLIFDGTYHYTYDAVGNRTAKFIDNNHNGVLDSGDTSVTTYTWDQRNRLIGEQFTPSLPLDSYPWTVQYTYDYRNCVSAPRTTGGVFSARGGCVAG
jgi:hypothetical protein